MLPAGVTDYSEVEPSRRIHLESERLCGFLQQQNSVPHQGCAFNTEAVFYCTVHEARFDLTTGAVLRTAGGKLLIDSIKNTGRLRHVTNRPAPSTPSPRAGIYSSIHTPYTNNYFHWLIETLPRLYSLQQYGRPVTLLMHQSLSELQQAVLAACLPDNVLVEYVESPGLLRLEQFILPSFLTTIWDFAYLPQSYLDYIRGRIFEGFGMPASHIRRRRIYISRAKAEVRQVRNEIEILDILRPLGFEAHYLETLTFTEQVRLFQEAEIVISPHGAGLSNLLFAGQIPVVEFTSRVITPVYFFLSLSLGQDYHYLYPQEIAGITSRLSTADGRRYSQARDADITVDIDQLKLMISQWV
jgi:capsular polysaccharide biosynthesis protein